LRVGCRHERTDILPVFRELKTVFRDYAALLTAAFVPDFVNFTAMTFFMIRRAAS
jgi:hypothetical protein